MRSFADLLETTAAAPATTAARNLTSTANVKTALKITTSASDALIDSVIPRVSELIVDYCRLARDAAGARPTFATETLRATWYVEGGFRQDRLLCSSRGHDLYLPWRTPLTSIDSVVEDGATLDPATDFVHLGGGQLRRMSCDTPAPWSTAKIVVVYKGGFSLAGGTLVANIDQALEAAAIEQVKYNVFGAGRDPAIRLANVYDVASVSYSVPGGDVMGADVLLPAVRSMVASYCKALA